MTRGLELVLALGVLASAPLAQDSWTVRAREVYSASGDPVLTGGFVRVDGKKIAALGAGEGRGGEILDVAAVTPGLIDLSVRIDTGSLSVEQSTETPVFLSVADGLDLFSHRWRRELESGVTTVLVCPDDADVLGGLGVVLKTGGPPRLEDRLVRADAVLRGSLGAQPSSGNTPPRGTAPLNFYFRRPTTRMGTEWLIRKSFYDAIQAEQERAELPPAERERNAILLRVLSGALPLSLQAPGTQDVHTAVYLKEEFSIPRMFIDASAEAWREPELLERARMGVVFPPFPFQGRIADGFVPDSYFMAWNGPAELARRGIPVALSGHGAQDVGDRLARQPGLAMRGGLSFAEALAAVTINPARMVGIDARVGSLDVGKDADLVLWDGRPFEPSSRIVGVFLEGELVIDPRRPQ